MAKLSAVFRAVLARGQGLPSPLMQNKKWERNEKKRKGFSAQEMLRPSFRHGERPREETGGNGHRMSCPTSVTSSKPQKI